MPTTDQAALKVLAGIARGHYTVSFPGGMETPEALPTASCPSDQLDVPAEAMESLERHGLVAPQGAGRSPITPRGHAALHRLDT